ncbi:MAG: hypothetical protein AB1531_00010 [Chloroflexota bacterium]
MRRSAYLLGILMLLLFAAACEERSEPFVVESSPTPPSVNGLPSPIPNTVDLDCETYLTTNWGKGPAEWGFPDGSNGEIRTRLLPLRFDSFSRLYFSDFINRRLLRYEQTNASPEPISLEPFFIWENPFPLYFSIAIRGDKIIVPYGYNQIGILSLSTGEVVGNVELPYNYDVFMPADSVIEVDFKGRLCTSNGIFDVGWENGRWNKISEHGCIDSFFWHDYIVGSSSSLSVYEEVLELFHLEQQVSVLVDTGLPKARFPFSSLFGVDENGNAYLSLLSATRYRAYYARYAFPTGKTSIGRMSPDIGYTVTVPSVSPDGILYILAYSDKDLSIQPRIIKCRFPDE